MIRMTEQWKPIPGIPGFEASTDGRIRNHKGKGSSPRILTPHIDRNNGKAHKCRITICVDGVNKTYQVARLIFLTWIGPIPDGKIVCNRDGDMTNTRVSNLVLGDRDARFRDRAKKIGGPNRRPVLRIDNSLSVVDAYRSARAAARLNGFTKDTILRHANLKIKSSVFAPDGYIYAWDDEKALRKTLARAMQELDALGIRYTYPGTEEYWNLPLEAEGEPPDLWLDAASLAGGGYFGQTMRIGA